MEQHEEVLTVEEAAGWLRVPAELMRAEIEAGRLPAIRIGSEIRIRRIDLAPKTSVVHTEPAAGDIRFDSLVAAPDFTEYRWPEKKGQPRDAEEFSEAWRTTAHLANGRTVSVLAAVGERRVIGKHRRHVVIFVNRLPATEFTEGDDGGVCASIIRPDGGSSRHLPPGEPIPPAYRSLRVAPYNSIISGPRALRSMAVVVEGRDFLAMMKHGVLRWMTKNR